MKKVSYTDEMGRRWLVGIPEDYEGLPEMGIPIGPPDMSSLKLPEEMETTLNHQLFDRKLFTLADVRRRPAEIQAALKVVFHLSATRIHNLYAHKEDRNG